MDYKTLDAPIDRRRALGLGGSIAGSIFAGLTLGTKAARAQATNSATSDSHDWKGTAKKIEQIIQAQGMFSNGVFSIEVDRNDITNVTLRGVPIKPAFEINGNLSFQKLDDDNFVMNSDLALKGDELDPFIDQLLAHDIVFQAEHQHFYDFDPLVWFIHFRKAGDPLDIARGVKAALNVTSTPFPQTSPTNPTTPLPADELGEILGASPTVGADGVVNFNVPREDPITLGGIRINPYLNVAAPIAFQPYGGDQNAAAVVDFAMIASEINDVMSTMRRKSWDIGCLYNQETDEQPQLYFSHQFKTGNALDLAREIRDGLNRTDSKFNSYRNPVVHWVPTTADRFPTTTKPSAVLQEARIL